VKRVVFTVVLATAATLPAVASAQRGGFGRGGRVPAIAREPGLVIPKPVNMINLLIARRQDVALSDSQFKQVIALKRELDSTNAPQVRKLDSLDRLFRGGTPMFSAPNAARRDSLAEARAVMREAVAAITDNNASARDRAYALLTGGQVEKAKAIESEAVRASEEQEKRRP
jgi:hypothetical protein